MDKGFDYATTLLPEFCANTLWRCSDQGVWLGKGEPSSKAFQILLFLHFFSSCMAERKRAFKQSVSDSSFS